MSDRSRWSTVSECVIVIKKKKTQAHVLVRNQALGRRLTPRFNRWPALHARVSRHGTAAVDEEDFGRALQDKAPSAGIGSRDRRLESDHPMGR